MRRRKSNQLFAPRGGGRGKGFSFILNKWTNEHEVVGVSGLFILDSTGQFATHSFRNSKQTFDPSSQTDQACMYVYLYMYCTCTCNVHIRCTTIILRTDVYIQYIPYHFYLFGCGVRTLLTARSRHAFRLSLSLALSLYQTLPLFWLSRPYPYLACGRPVGGLCR